MIISTHTLTWSVTLQILEWRMIVQHFNSHAHVERDRIFTYFTDIDFNFNSHAHVERDLFINTPYGWKLISTHTLTWSVTKLRHFMTVKTKISTHTLTWSVTDFKGFTVVSNPISTHTLTWSVTDLGECTFFTKFISTHTLTWSVTLFLCRFFLSFCHFNSHAHVERDHT